MADAVDLERSSWRSRAVARSVDPAREAAEERVQRFIDTAIELVNSPTGAEFTVQNVVDRSGLSLRSFYHHFAGKYELLLAVFEESVRSTAQSLLEECQKIEDPRLRLRFFTTEYFRICRSGRLHGSATRMPNRSMGNFAHQLMFDHPEEAAETFAPLVAALHQVLDEATRSGAVRDDLDNAEVAAFILQSIMFNAFATTVSGSTTDALPGHIEMMWHLLLHGLAGEE